MSDLGEWAYHATRPQRLVSIALYGLEPRWPDIGGQPKGVYFCPTAHLAEAWNDVILRFPWPETCEEDPYGCGIFLEDEYFYTNYYTERRIPPDQIERLMSDGTWKPLVRSVVDSIPGKSKKVQ